jgi:ABC-type lipoprotein release transport system permease subunit
MNDFFGLSMTVIMFILLGILGVAMATIGYVIARSRIMFMMGLRNIPRRMGQTVLIVIGLMLSTLIISAALTTGDTVDHSLTSQSYKLLGHVDEVIYRAGEDDAPGGIRSTIPQPVAEEIRAELSGDPNIDGFLPVLFEQAPVVNPVREQSEPLIQFAGVDTMLLDGFPDVISAETGDELDVASLAPDEVFMNKSAADELDAEAGDAIQVYVFGQGYDFTVADIVEDKFLTGVGDFEQKQGVVMPLDTLQTLTRREGEVSAIAVSNEGGVRDTLDLTAPVVTSVWNALSDLGYSGRGGSADAVALEVNDTKSELIDSSEEAGNFLATFFLIFGLFSIGAGILLVIMIFVMLAAERKSEMGMARAVGTKRSHLVQMFMSEGMAYNVISAMVGAALGILISFGITAIMARIFSEYGFDIEAYVTVRTVVISYSLGVVLTFLTVVFSSWRVSNLNIVAAIRDIPENVGVNPEERTVFGYSRGLLNASVAGFFSLTAFVLAARLTGLAPLLVILFAIGLVGPFLYVLRGNRMSLSSDHRAVASRESIPLWPFYLVVTIPFYVVALLVTWITRDRRPKSVPAWLLIVGALFIPLGLVLVAMQDREKPVAWAPGVGTFLILLGIIFVQWGMDVDGAFGFAFGFSVIALGIAMVIRFFGVPARAAFTAASVALLLLWGFTAGGRLEWAVGKLDGDAEMFFLSGVAMVTASTFLFMYNADIALGVVSKVGGAFRTILPAMRTAIAYPLANKFRTGMTMAMISLVVFALTMMSTMNLNFDRLFLADSARGGWDVTVDENPNNPIRSISTALGSAGSSIQDGFRAEGVVSIADESVASEGSLSFSEYPVRGVDEGFVDGGNIPLSARAFGFESDDAVWQALKTRDDVAIVDGFTISGGGFFDEDSFSIGGIDSEADEFEPVMIRVADDVTGNRALVEVIGVIDFGASQSFFGIFVSDSTFGEVYGDPELSRHFIGLEDPGESKDVAREIEATLFTAGVQADSLKEQVDDAQALNRNFFRLMQGFMALGLFVGIAAVGVIAFRTVVERRQQIGMLRAIGYKRSTVALSFVMESSFISLLSVVSGIGLAIWLSYFLLTSDDFPGEDKSYHVPWIQLAGIGLFTFVASVVMTIIPSRQAASVPTAEALRYE